MELLLLSNSTLPGKAWLEHALPTIAGQLNAVVLRIHPFCPGDANLG
ncbi:alpha-aspartyl dipeptidase Peptidase E [Klebsiella michiganensis]|uniref:Alpha-aspartyl dipeptidase Peptidase E n=1 Tax=Klebsiella michiganensis TaxID=1134687 RepID=A0A7H4M259_9ENTR|nr:alpha-aspartyl dipeptidase Peptidase E [Klebsiella michiganensis]